jgi:hypothetical protein
MGRITGWHHDDQVTFGTLLGKTLARVEVADDKSEIIFETSNGERYGLYHSQDCCENVGIEEVVGDLSDLIGSPVMEAEEVSSEGAPPPPGEYVQSYTWTFYKIGTAKGAVTLRWLGESNGYYSESVDFIRLTH